MELSRIETEMHKLEKKLGYTFNDILLLAEAMKSQKLGKLPEDGDNQNEYSNESHAFLGDTIIKFLIAEFLYKDKAREDKRKGKMTVLKARLENNKIFHRIMTEEKLILYSYHDKHFNMDNPPDHEKVVSKKHDPYIEAIATAIYMDGGWDAVTTWFKEWRLPRLVQYQDNL